MEGLCSVWGQGQGLLVPVMLGSGYNGVVLRMADLQIQFSWHFPTENSTLSSGGFGLLAVSHEAIGAGTVQMATS